ncbi:MAG TPA: sigma-70 family RNA polymerase sigma factor [Solirubrobacteraceae bacterium]|nr:sigma-70 family RNA polymerase sigma factor [Solirubrobacteraceae bacterium]
MLRTEFGGLRDQHDELYHEAWAELLELRARGQELTSVKGLLKTIAWRRARDSLRKMRPDAIDPMSATIQLEPDSAPLPEDHAQVRIDAAVLRQIIDRLEPRQAAALKLRFDWGLSGPEIQEQLKISRKALEKLVTAAYKAVAEEAGLDAQGERRWTRRQRSLLVACEMGLATEQQREQAQRMIDEDPACRALLREMRSTVNDVAAALPVPVLATDERAQQALAPVIDRTSDAWASVKHAASNLLGRGPGSATAVEQTAGAGGALLGGGVATKAVMACLAAGGAAVCLQTGTLPGLGGGSPPAEAEAPPRMAVPKPERTARAPVQQVTTTAKAEEPKPQSKPKAKKREEPKRTSTAPTSSPKATPEPSPVPEGTTEFGPGAVGSSAAPQAPAQAPTDGGGEFGP